MGKPKSDVSKTRKKTRKAKDSSRSCAKCSFFDTRNKSDPICSLTGESVCADDICKRCDIAFYAKCQRCGATVKYRSAEECHNAILHFTMSNNGSSSGQNIHLCKKCMLISWSLFHDLLDAIFERKDPTWKHDDVVFEEDFRPKVEKGHVDCPYD